MSTLDQLVVPQSVTYFFNLLLGTYQAQGFPVQSWQVGGVERTRLMAFASALADKATNYAPQMAAGILLDYTSSDGAGGGWLPLTATEFFNLTQNPATYTQGNITLTAASGVGTQTYQAGQLTAVFAATGNRYRNTGVIVIPVGPGNVSGQFQAEFAGAKYSDPSSSGALTLVTPIPGVTLTNPATTYTTVTKTGAGTGSLTLGGSPVGAHQVIVTITGTGEPGTATWSWSLDGAADVSAGNAVTATNIGGVGINITLTAGGSGTSFCNGDSFVFRTPGSWITQQGGDIETDAALITRCRNRWPSLSSIPTKGYYELLATSTPSVGSQVTQVIVQTDPNVNNKINLVVAGPGGALPGATITAIQSYISPRAIGGDRVIVGSPTPQAITLAFTATVKSNLLASAQTSIGTSLTNYVNSVGINGTLRISSIVELIMLVSGVIDVTGVTINGSASNLGLGSTTTFVIASSPTINGTYVTA